MGDNKQECEGYVSDELSSDGVLVLLVGIEIWYGGYPIPDREW